MSVHASSCNYSVCGSNRQPVLFFDTASAHGKTDRSYCFSSPLEIFATRELKCVAEILETVSCLSSRYWIAGYLAYEAAYALEGRLRAMKGVADRYPFDLVWFGVFEKPLILQNGEIAPFLADGNEVPENEKDPAIGAEPVIDRKEFGRAFSRIKKYIARGHTYQINYTYDVAVRSRLDHHNLYTTLRRRQPVSYAALIDTGSLQISSFSPELFFHKSGRIITVKPMKGTAGRGRFLHEDECVARELSADPKNRAENVMIVDLLRNDLGKICEIGSVSTRKLFEIETHPTLHQMTSTVQGQLRENISFRDIIQALFPCGSVTGAPKIRSIEIIHELERGFRGVYCGAIGYLSPQGSGIFSVPIRTLQRKSPRSAVWQYRVGSGIVWNSGAESEWQECKTKCTFLTNKQPSFELLESLFWTGTHFILLSGHRSRIRDSAEYFDFRFDAKRFAGTLTEMRGKMRCAGIPAKVRLLMSREGEFRWDFAPLGEEKSRRVIISDTSVDSNNRFLFHKTTYRPWYDKAIAAIRDGICFDVLHVNESGELTEGARSNIFLALGGELVTPPLTCGLLGGVLRAQLLRTGKCREKAVRVRNLRRADAIYCGNSVRGLVQVYLEKP